MLYLLYVYEIETLIKCRGHSPVDSYSEEMKYRPLFVRNI